MNLTIFTILTITVVALAHGQNPSSDSVRPILLRLFPEFGTVYRPIKGSMMEDRRFGKDFPFDYYNMTISAAEYSQISEESLSMINAKVFKREIIFHPEPNFEVAGSRYFYRRDPKQDEPVEIELVSPQDRLFREVLEPKRLFYLTSFENIQYTRKNPMLPYYEVTFTCEHETLKKIDEEDPAITYHDRSLGWTTRYLLNMPMFGVSTSVQLLAFADIRNRADVSFQIKHLVLAAGDVRLLSKSDRTPRSSVMKFSSMASADSRSAPMSMSFPSLSVGEQASGIYFYDIKSLFDTILQPQSVQSVPLITANMTVKSFVIYSSSFSTTNDQGKLIRSYNISSSEAFLPAGRWLLQERGQFLGEFDLEALARSEIYTMKFGVDPDIRYQRKVSLVERNDQNETITYNVEYSFFNAKESRDITVEFHESFAYQKYFEMKSFSSQIPLHLFGSELRGEFVLPHSHVELSFSYQVIIYENNPNQRRN